MKRFAGAVTGDDWAKYYTISGIVKSNENFFWLADDQLRGIIC
jgi:hypothetical protein